MPRRASAIATAALALLAVGCGGGDHPKAPGPTAAGRAPNVVTGSVARIPGRSAADVAGAAALYVYGQAGHPPRGLVLTPHFDWQQAMVAAQFAAHPLNAAILPTAGDYLPPAPSDLLNRLTPTGFPRAKGLQALILGQAGDDVLTALQDRKLNLTQLRAKNPAELTFKAVPFRGGWAHNFSDSIVVVSSGSRDFALPGAAWSAYSGDTLVFVARGSIPDATRRVLVQRQKLRLDRPHIYVIGPSDVISDDVAGQLGAYGPVTRIGGETPAATSVALAKFKDRKTGFGWGLSHGPANVSLMNVHDWGNVFAGFALAGGGPQAPLLLTESASRAPSEVLAYLRGLHNEKGNQAFVLGDESSISKREVEQVGHALAPTPPTS